MTSSGQRLILMPTALYFVTEWNVCTCSDVMTVLGLYPLQPSDGVGGHEGVGEVIATGADVKTLKKGDRAVPLGNKCGTWRTHIVSDESKWHAIDKNLSLHDAATLIVNPGTAMLMLEQYEDLKEGDCVIQNGANSEVRLPPGSTPSCSLPWTGGVCVCCCGALCFASVSAPAHTLAALFAGGQVRDQPCEAARDQDHQHCARPSQPRGAGRQPEGAGRRHRCYPRDR